MAVFATKKCAQVYLILDNLREPRRAPVKEWLAAHAAQIVVPHLPGDSPELNPNARLNRTLKRLPALRDERTLPRQAVVQLCSSQNQRTIIQGCFQSADPVTPREGFFLLPD